MMETREACQGERVTEEYENLDAMEEAARRLVERWREEDERKRSEPVSESDVPPEPE